MPRKRSQKYAELEIRIAQALESIRNGESTTVYATSKTFDVPYSTLSRRVKGHSNHTQGHISSQILSQAEEEALQLWCKRLTAGGYPANHRVIRELAGEILTRRVASVNTD